MPNPTKDDFLKLAEEMQRISEGPSAVKTTEWFYTHLQNILTALRLAAQAEECKRDAERLREHVAGIQFASNGYRPACSGWEAERGRGCTPGKHTSDCWIADALAAEEKTP